MILKRVLLGALFGSVIALIYNYLAENSFLEITISPGIRNLIIGALGGSFVGLFLIGLGTLRSLYIADSVKLTIPQFSEFTFTVNREYRAIAWSLFVETMTRVSTQPLESEQGNLREALNSLYELFSITRKLLKNMKPSQNTDTVTVELFALKMLNNTLRPFLSKWHPKLSSFEKKPPRKPDQEWKLNKEFRKELEVLRKTVLDYSKGFGEIAQVPQLDKYFEN